MGGPRYASVLLIARVVSSTLLYVTSVWKKALKVTFNPKKLSAVYRRTTLRVCYESCRTFSLHILKFYSPIFQFISNLPIKVLFKTSHLIPQTGTLCEKKLYPPFACMRSLRLHVNLCHSRYNFHFADVLSPAKFHSSFIASPNW